MTINIFDEAKEKVVPEWAKFITAGDAAQGTYVGKIVNAIDGYGNEQIVYQLLQDDGRIINVGFGLNKKVLHQDMLPVTFGQIVGFKYKGKVSVKDKFGKPVEVKDYALYQDSKIVDPAWLNANKDNMPTVTVSTNEAGGERVKSEADIAFDSIGAPTEDVPFSSQGSITNEDKLAVITKLAIEKLGATDTASVKDKVMAATGSAFIPVNFQKIIDDLSAL